MISGHRKNAQATTDLIPWVWLVAFAYCAGLYLIVRFEGRWSENDSAVLTDATRSIIASGRLVSTTGHVYPNGYAYQSIIAFVHALTGIDVVALQQLVVPLLTALVVPPLWMLYRDLTGSARGASLSTAILLMQPDFMFVILRSSHEKFTRILMIVSLFWLVRSLRFWNQPRLFSIHVVLFYFTAFALITSNNLLAHSFIVALACAWLGGRFLMQKSSRSSELGAGSRVAWMRLANVATVCIGLVYVFTFYVYTPAEADLSVLGGLWSHVEALLLDVQTRSSNTYGQVATAWINLYVYFLVSLATWVVIVTSFLLWIRKGLKLLRHREQARNGATQLLWLLYAAFALQGAAAVVVDASGALGSNLQLRVFPSFSMIAVAVVGAALAEWKPTRCKRFIKPALVSAGCCLALLALLKATNEPLLSNKWVFYSPGELSALDWTDAHLRNSYTWTEFDERLEATFLMLRGDPSHQNHLLSGADIPPAQNVLVSHITQLRSVRLGQDLPNVFGSDRVFDNGDVQLYHLRPQTPFER